jgi:predicted TIM-barrel fold metal-dependent hydrolase
VTRLPPPPLVGPVVDADGHVVEAPSAWAGLPDDVRPRIEPDAHGFEHVLVGSTEILAVPLGTLARPGSTFSDPADVRPLADAQPGGSDPVARLADMDAEGIDQAVLFPTIALYLAVVEDPAASVLLARAYNDWLADYCAAAPRRLFGAALLPLQDPVAAPAELRRAVTELGFPAAFVRPNPCAGRSLCHRDYEPLWDTAEELGVPLGVHEGSSVILPTLGADRPFNPLVLHAVSHPFEEMLACAQLIAFGVLERHPGLRFVFLESGGGWAPFWLERLDEQAESFGGFCPDLRLLPSEYFARQCAVSFEVDERTLPALLPFVGRDRVVWGSDYPHHDATFPGAVDALRRTLAPLVPADQARVLGHNARRLYGLPSPHVGVAAPVHDYFAAVTLRDPDLLAGVLAPRAVLTVAGRRLEGTEAILDFYRTGAFAFDDLRPDPGPLAVEGGTVTVPIALHLGGTDTEVEDVFTVAGDRITALDIRGLAPEVQGALRRAAGEASRA